MLGFWRSLGMEAKSGASGSFFHALRCSRVCTQDLPPSPALISEHRPSTDITIPRPWLFPRLPSSSVLRSPTSSLSGGIIPDGPNRLLHLPIHPFVYRPESSRVRPPWEFKTGSNSDTPTLPLFQIHTDHHPQATSNNPSHSLHGTVLFARRGPVADLGQASFCGPESSLSFRLRMTFSLAVYTCLTPQIQIGTPYRFPSPARASRFAQCPHLDNLQPATCNRNCRKRIAVRPQGSVESTATVLLEDSGPTLDLCGLPVLSDLLAISDSTTRNARVWPDPPETLAFDAVCGQIEGVVRKAHRPRASSVASGTFAACLRLLPSKHRSQRSTVSRRFPDGSCA